MVLEEQRGGWGKLSRFSLRAVSNSRRPFFPPLPFSPSSSSTTLPKTYGSAPGGRVRDSTTFGCARGFLLNTIKYSSRFIHQYKKYRAER